MNTSTTWHLVNSNLQPVKVGDKFLDFRGDPCTVTGLGHPPHTPASSGRIELDGVLYYPTIVDCKWMTAPDLYEARVSALEYQGMTRSDAQGIVDAEILTEGQPPL